MPHQEGWVCAQGVSPARLSPSLLGVEGGLCGTEVAAVVQMVLTRAVRSPRSPCQTTVPS